jgi:type IV pilus assembly protein PilM
VLPFIHFKPPSLVGLDVHADEIRLLQFRQTQTTFLIENCAIHPLSPGAIIDDKIKQIEVVQAAISELVQETKTYGCNVAIALPAASVISKRIKLPVGLPPKEQETEIHANLKQYLPGINEALCLDFVELDVADAERREMLLVAARLEQLQTYFNVVQSAGLVPKIVDIDSYALARAVIFAVPKAVQYPVAILDGGKYQVQLTVFQHKQVYFNQSWQVRDKNFFCTQLRRALQLCSTMHNQLAVNDLVLAGNLSRHDVEIGQHFLPRIHEVNPFQNMIFPLPAIKERVHNALPRLLVCCGLAMRRAPSC